jgi:WD40 repeat protein
MAFAPHRCEVATTSPEKFLRLWDPVACKVLRESDSRLSVNDLAFAPEGRHLACAVANGTVHVLRLQDPPKK